MNDHCLSLMPTLYPGVMAKKPRFTGLDVVGMEANDNCLSLMPTLYPGVMAKKPRFFGTLDAMWLAFQALANNISPAINGEFVVSLPTSSTGVRSSTPSGPRPAGNGRSQGGTPSQSPAWQTESRNNQVVMNVSKSIRDGTEFWTDTSSNCWPLDEHRFAMVFAVCVSIQTDDPPLGSCLLTTTARAAAFPENRGHCLNCHEYSHSLRQCRQQFIYASDC